MANVKTGLNSIVKYLSTKKETGRRSIGLLVDGPNVLRKEFNVNLEEIRDVLKEYGNVKIGRVFLNQYASDKLVEAIENNGFEPIICSSDVDVRLAVEGMELVYNPTIDTIALVTRDADFKPLLNKANEHGKETIIFGVEPGFSTALRNSADYVIILENDEMNYYDDSHFEKDDEDGAVNDTEIRHNSRRKKEALMDY
ncbi:TIGR00288 family NYN domain-containing protein [Methanolobus profundi]|uniref:TIGR00288 family protein n=1 Tax=Methanolobus profundi TaxID=487685 RepID=A0A1I4P4V8_9EURY|nr:TIGR00288 family NYN domain-containing protein [Methanolobus profundi]SFM22393.1 TIGR00288 family protein [Methanolobus profundi]